MKAEVIYLLISLVSFVSYTVWVIYFSGDSSKNLFPKDDEGLENSYLPLLTMYVVVFGLALAAKNILFNMGLVGILLATQLSYLKPKTDIRVIWVLATLGVLVTIASLWIVWGFWFMTLLWVILFLVLAASKVEEKNEFYFQILTAVIIFISVILML